MHKQESFIEKETQKILWDFDTKEDLDTLVRKLSLVITKNQSVSRFCYSSYLSIFCIYRL